MSSRVRYLKHDAFIRYCKDLNVKTDEGELEYYEERGLMLPRVRIVLPKGYVVDSLKWQCDHRLEHPLKSDWTEIEDLYDRWLVVPDDFTKLTDDELIDSFDRALDRNSPYIYRPEVGRYRAWGSYRISAITTQGYEVHGSTVEHYYSYWQVHQLYELKKYPHLYKDRHLVANLTDKYRKRQAGLIPWARPAEHYRTFKGLAHSFDALSFYETMYYREFRRTFAPIPERHRVQRLSESEHREYSARLKQYAKVVFDRHYSSENDLFKFLADLVELRMDYLEDERNKLANSLVEDIESQARLIHALTGIDREEIANEIVNRKFAPFWVKRHFLHLDPLVGERYDAIEFLGYVARTYTQAMTKVGITTPTITISGDEIEGILGFCELEGIAVLPFSLGNMIAVGNETEQKFRRELKYTNVKNLLTAYEYFLKALVTKNKSAVKEYATLTMLVKDTFASEKWFAVFSSYEQKGFVKGRSEDDFAEKLAHLLEDETLSKSESEFWAQTFLMSCLARNLTVHTHPKGDWFYYGDYLGEIIYRSVYAFVYTWHFAKRVGWKTA